MVDDAGPIVASDVVVVAMMKMVTVDGVGGGKY